MKKGQIPPTPTENTSVRKESGHELHQAIPWIVRQRPTAPSRVGSSQAERGLAGTARLVCTRRRIVHERGISWQHEVECRTGLGSGFDLGLAGSPMRHRRL